MRTSVTSKDKALLMEAKEKGDVYQCCCLLLSWQLIIPLVQQQSVNEVHSMTINPIFDNVDYQVESGDCTRPKCSNEEIDLLKSTLSGKEKSIAFLQSEKEKILSEKKDLADSYLDEIVCLKNANKVARDILQRFNMPTETIPMLFKKPKKGTADLHKDLLGTVSLNWAYWLPANERASQTSNPDSPVTPFVHKSRPPSQVLSSLRQVNAAFNQFEDIIKERTTKKPDYVSEWCFDYAKQFVEQQLDSLVGLMVETLGVFRGRSDELTKANTHSRAANTEKLSALTAENTKLKAQVTGKTCSGPSTSETPKAALIMNNHSTLPAKSANARRVEAHHRTLNKKNRVDSNLLVKHSVSVSRKNNVCGACNNSLVFGNHNDCLVICADSVNVKPHQTKRRKHQPKKEWKPIKRVWKAISKPVANSKPQWKPTGRHFSLFEKFPLTRIMDPTDMPIELPPSASSSPKITMVSRFTHKLSDRQAGSTEVSMVSGFLEMSKNMTALTRLLAYKKPFNEVMVMASSLKSSEFGTLNELLEIILSEVLPMLKYDKGPFVSILVQLGKSKKDPHIH
ncbi:hypothetical protein Tco_0365181 [Tanacetum coccineum]